MARNAKKPIILPPKTEASFSGGVMAVKGPLGELRMPFKEGVKITIADGKILFEPAADTIRVRELWGSYAAHTRNMIAGVNKPYEKKLAIEGIGYKADVKGNELVLSVGFSHQVNLPIPAGVKVVSDKNGIAVSGIDKEKVGQFAAVIRATKKPEPYLGKGIRYADEIIRRKQGKKAA
ncbi:50S ribosomal protein L6 [Patescibacteria group bacterium]|nr:50S ribosomal protein L6 [Patescibacteria group bacterium]MDE1946881.1 50S ribosomal protein L6 [Patescibacteria group bacterium]MDE2010701.1 50S ribosomal protein L6 [Patescibacteria group bacterium]MDE2232693.1 50S ribosomal protein L6 [Patescibacteria group bacterium]